MLPKVNLKHLHYFWLIAREGSIARASEVLDLAPQTLSGQLASLEESLGHALFRRENRSLKLTEKGQWVYQYAEQIFALTEEMESGLKHFEKQAPLKLRVGIAASIHKLIAWQLLEPATQLERSLNLRCHTGQTPDLIRSLKKQAFDLVLTDQLPEDFSQSGLVATELMRTPISLFATPDTTQRLQADFPNSLHGERLLATSFSTPYFQQLLLWLQQRQITPEFVAEIDDSALIKVFGSRGMGIFAAPHAIRDEVCRQYGVSELARIDGVMDAIFAVTRTASPQHLAIRSILAHKSIEKN
ncbi:LysR substrate-binding domain-containing protein [Marinospirillum alkaliphilum]|uniref:LysR family transcriptional regulator, transcriptional activator of nhaA n=1 Tax=Marinospirillum alkaliphilum DSM 21637 TaxID=1122209 RepID=A0A1K1X0H3_9GAMM|nr:LysR substrate-binding domain-containing protein [Marinospirillum alkaliphilum]SFX43015.1 LysR family transcriptional regulator, transcriptional activator of nhaA [Marinospirillum alkaliphilum DSM 21637]